MYLVQSKYSHYTIKLLTSYDFSSMAKIALRVSGVNAPGKTSLIYTNK